MKFNILWIKRTVNRFSLLYQFRGCYLARRVTANNFPQVLVKNHRGNKSIFLLPNPRKITTVLKKTKLRKIKAIQKHFSIIVQWFNPLAMASEMQQNNTFFSTFTLIWTGFWQICLGNGNK